jgi:LPS export ABC transporter protein LptC
LGAFQVRFYRALLLGLILVVTLSVVGNYYYRQRLRRGIIKPVAQILAPDLVRSADTLEYSSHEDGKVKFTVRANKLLETKQGKSLLEGIRAEDFNPDGSVLNRITSQKAEYDKDRNQVYFFGDVKLYLGKDIEIRMESLRYDIGAQRGTSDDLIRFLSSKATGSAQGVRYDNATRNIELVSDLSFVVRRTAEPGAGAEPGKTSEYNLLAKHGVYIDKEQWFRLEGEARVISDSGTLSGDNIYATFTQDKRHLTSLSSHGNAMYESRDAEEIRTLRGDHLDFNIGKDSQALESIHSSGHAGFALKSSNGMQNLTAEEFLLTLDPVQGRPRAIQSQRGVHFAFTRGTQSSEVSGEWLEATFLPGSHNLERMTVRDQARMTINISPVAPDELQAETIVIAFQNQGGRSLPRVLQASKSVVWKSPGQTVTAPGRALTSDALLMRYADSGESLDSGSATGKVVLIGLPRPGSSGTQLQRLQGDRTDFLFYPGNNRLQRMTGEGNVRVDYRSDATSGQPKGEEFSTASDTFTARFKEVDGAVESVNQSGRFTYQEGNRSAGAGTCDFSASTGKLVLRDHPSMRDADSTSSGDLIEYDRQLNVLTIRGNVQSVLRSAAGRSQGFMTSSGGNSFPAMVTAEEMAYSKDKDQTVFSGNVHLLSAESQLQTQRLTILGSGERVDASGEVRHLILGLGKPAPAKPTGTLPASGTKVSATGVSGPVVVQCEALAYSRSSGVIHYEGNVFMDSADAKIWTDSLDAYLDTEGKKVQRAKAQGHLRITQPGREVKGQAGEYFLSEGKFVVTGNPVEYADGAKRTSTQGQLTFYTSDDRIMAVR